MNNHVFLVKFPYAYLQSPVSFSCIIKLIQFYHLIFNFYSFSVTGRMTCFSDTRLWRNNKAISLVLMFTDIFPMLFEKKKKVYL